MTRATWTQADVRRAIRAAESVGKSVRAVEIGPDGTIRVLTEEKTALPVVANDSGPDWTEYAGEEAIPRA